jgi:hypothetical protein
MATSKTSGTSKILIDMTEKKSRLAKLRDRALVAARWDIYEKFNARYNEVHNAQQLIFSCAWGSENVFFMG